MSFDDALRRYRAGHFGDHDVTTCTGLSVRAWRELIKLGAVRTITDDRGRGRVRQCDPTTFKRAAAIAALNSAGLSLAVAGRIAYFVPFDAVLYACWDPSNILLHVAEPLDPVTGLPPRLPKPKTDWFDPDRPAKVDRKNDWLLAIYDRRFVGVIVGNGEPAIFGDLRNDGTKFVSWFAYDRQNQVVGGAIKEVDQALLPNTFDFVAKWENPLSFADRIDPAFLDYSFEDHQTANDPLVAEADAVAKSPVVAIKINITLAIRKALRRYLGMDRAARSSEMG